MKNTRRNLIAFLANAVVATLLSNLPSASAQAQSSNTGYWLEASVRTFGTPNNYSIFAPFAYGVKDVALNADPAGITFGNATLSLYGDTSARVTASDAGLAVSTYAYGRRLAGSAFTGSSPSSTSEVKFGDTLTVVGPGLSKGTAVTLEFNNIASGVLNGSGAYAGDYTTTVDIGGQTTTTSAALPWNGTPRAATSVPIIVKCHVGDRLNLRLSASARAFSYFTGTEVVFGEATVSAQMRLALTPNTSGAGVTSASGRIY